MPQGLRQTGRRSPVKQDPFGREQSAFPGAADGWIMAKNKKLIWSLLSLLLAILTITTVLSQLGEMPLQQLAESVRDADKRYLAAAAVCGALFLLLEGAAICCILRGAGYDRNVGGGLLYSASDIYFSAVTPSATGGQPASALFMVRDGIPAGVVTATLLINLILYTLSILLLGLGAAATSFRLLYGFRLISKVLIGAGFAILTGLMAMFFALLGKGEAVFGALGSLARLLHRWKLLHRLDYWLGRLDHARQDYDECAELIRGKTSMLIRAFILNFFQRASQIAVPMFTYLALGGRGSQAAKVFASQCFINIGYNCVPVPGAMGVADFLMVDGFSDLMEFEDAIHLEVLSRSISFYICVAVSGVIVLIGSLIQRHRKRR